MLLAAFLATVISISNGDALTVLDQDKQQITVHLAEIDAPEKTQLSVPSRKNRCQKCATAGGLR